MSGKRKNRDFSKKALTAAAKAFHALTQEKDWSKAAAMAS